MLGQFSYLYRAVILDVYDGDSITIDIDLGLRIWARGQKVRLYGVNTPELRDERGKEVRDIVREWLPIGSVVTVMTFKDRTGKYGRWLAEVWPEGWEKSVNRRLVSEGLAVDYYP